MSKYIVICFLAFMVCKWSAVLFKVRFCNKYSDTYKSTLPAYLLIGISVVGLIAGLLVTDVLVQPSRIFGILCAGYLGGFLTLKGFLFSSLHKRTHAVYKEHVKNQLRYHMVSTGNGFKNIKPFVYDVFHKLLKNIPKSIDSYEYLCLLEKLSRYKDLGDTINEVFTIIPHTESSSVTVQLVKKDPLLPEIAISCGVDYNTVLSDEGELNNGYVNLLIERLVGNFEVDLWLRFPKDTTLTELLATNTLTEEIYAHVLLVDFKPLFEFTTASSYFTDTLVRMLVNKQITSSTKLSKNCYFPYLTFSIYDRYPDGRVFDVSITDTVLSVVDTSEEKPGVPALLRYVLEDKVEDILRNIPAVSSK